MRNVGGLGRFKDRVVVHIYPSQEKLHGVGGIARTRNDS